MKKLSLLIVPIAAMLLTACEKKEDTKKIERCIDQICEKVAYDGEKLYVLTTLNVHSKDGLSVVAYANHPVEIPAEEAIKISKNWDLNNIKLYTNTDKKLQEHENKKQEFIKVSFPEGLTARKIASILDKNKVCIFDDFMNAVKNKEKFKLSFVRDETNEIIRLI